MTIVVWVLLSIFFVWMGFLTFLFWSLYRHYNTIVKGTTKKTLQSLLEDILKRDEKTKEDIALLSKRCDTIELDGKMHIQKIGLLRFNPFHDTGGDQSFILALVDGHDTGVVISGLYSRSGTRWYAKKVQNGKSLDHELSEEEAQALKQAEKVEKTEKEKK